MYEVRFMMDGMSMMKTTKFSTKKCAESYYNKVISVGKANHHNGQVAFWNKGWLEKTDKF